MPFLKVEHFIENCREVYFCAEEYSDAAFIVTNFCLYSVFFELGITKTAGSLGEECQEYIDTCRNNLEAALANLNILMPATQESIMALAVGVSFFSLYSVFRRETHQSIGHACARDLQAISGLEPSFHGHASVSDVGIPSHELHGA